VKKVFTILPPLLLCIIAYTQTRLRFERIGIKEGLSNEKVNCIFQDSKGFIWIGTAFGLNRFDGISCKTWYNDEKDSNSLVNNTVLGIAEDNSGNLWIGTQEGVSRFDPVNEKFLNFSSKGKGADNFNKENCYSFIDKNNTVWIGSNKGASWYDEKENRFKDVPMELTRPGVTRNLFATSFLHDSKKRLWVSTSFGIKLISPDKRSSASFHIPEPGLQKLVENACTQLAEDRNGRIFAGTWNKGILIFDENKKEFKHRIISAVKAQNVVFSILPVTENNIDYLWLGTNEGLLKIKTTEIFSAAQLPQSIEYRASKTDAESISNEVIYSLSTDRGGNTWIATASGINKIDPLQQQFQTINLSTQNNTSPDIITMAESFEETGAVYIFSSNHLYKGNLSEGVFRSLPCPASDINSIRKGKEFFWIASFKGLWQCDKKMRLVKKWLGKGFKTNSGDARIKSVLEDKEGKIWCGLWRGGIIKIDPQTGLQENYLMDSSAEYNLKPYIINSILEDSKDNLWFASNNGLYQYLRSEKKFTRHLFSQAAINANVDAIESLLQTTDGKIWIGTRQGLRYFDYTTGKFTSVDFDNNSVNDFISGIIEDENKTLWLATPNGLLQFNPEAKQLKQYNSANNLPANDLTSLFQKDAGGIMYIGSPGAVTLFNPSSLKKNTIAYPPLITSVLVNNQPVSVKPGSYKLRFNQSISIHFVALNYSNASANQYAYLLEGLDEDWKPLGNNRNIYFANLPQGKYTLKIKAANSDGVWNETTADLTIRIMPPFWKTWWFISLFVLAIASAAYAFYWVRLQKAIEMERLRTRIATDLHDDIGATLSSISMYSAAVKEQVKKKMPQLEPVLNKMGENSREMVTNMSDIVWAINPGNDDGQKLVQRMEGYARDICAVKNVQLDFTGDEKLNELKLPLEHRKNIYLIFKEALNNALKYAEAEKIYITVERKANEIYLQVKDNGRGFQTEIISKGNGLKNLTTRAAEINGQIEINSIPGKGTNVELICKV
jgi:ligand-binding sensor domain-containing protein/two-component sensor histidine kinase